ncbi:hypothetical protein V1512DRAFT_15199 [Lipomyces arxii]|uniref:uncharacterized protein n=1 Tax=Lipomyces arxii TaxID=56418 RepID=UPI0034D0053C
MRDVNFFSVLNNKAAANMTPTMYDRRALDCPFDRPLVNSLSSLCVLVTSSQMIRESLATDGGIDRLIAILKSCQGMHSRDLLTSWKWSLALQCLSAVGVRGSESVRRRVVEADIVPVLATVLDNFLEAIEKLRQYHDYFVRQSSTSQTSQTESDSTQSIEQTLGHRSNSENNDSEQEEPRRRQRRNADEPIFDSGINVNAADMFVTMIGAAVATTQAQQQQETQTQSGQDISQVPSSTTEQVAEAAQRPAVENAAAPANNSHLYYHSFHHHRHQHRHHRSSHAHIHTHSYASPSVISQSAFAAGAAQTSAESRVENSDSAMPMDIDEAEVDLTGNSSVHAIEDAQNSSSDEVQYTEAPSYSADIPSRIIDMEFNNGSSGAVESEVPVVVPSAHPSLSPFGVSLQPSGTTQTQTEPLPEQGAVPPIETAFPGVSPTSTTLPAFLGAQDNLPREEDVLMALQLLAYVSKYVNLRPYFQKTHIIPSLSIRTDVSEVAEMAMSQSEAGFDDTSLFPADESLIAEEYKLPTLNLFQLVERFTTRAYMGDLHYWASVIMRNSCRKDESRGGVRQCGYFECGKWEEYPKQFAKCRRCRRTKYCSKFCQSKAWCYHRHWCVPPE